MCGAVICSLVRKNYAGESSGTCSFVFLIRNSIFVLIKASEMKKIVALVLLAAFVSACSQYTCPTYTKKETPKPAKSAQQRI
jgi:hypothetical protein